MSFSRPGYGASTRRPGRRVVDVVGDVAALLAWLEASGDCYVVGHSGGGPHALACAAELPGVRGTLVIAGVVPADAPGIDFLAGMGEDNLEEFGAAFAGEATLRTYLEAARPGLLGASAEQIIAEMATLLPEVDRAVIDAEYAEDLSLSFSEGLSLGVDGWLDDDLAFVAPWGLDPGAIASPVSIWQGDQDLMVPFAHGEWLARVVPGADAHLLAGVGHLSLVVDRAPAMLDALLALG